MTICTKFVKQKHVPYCLECGNTKDKHIKSQEKDKTLEDMLFINLSCTEELTREFIKIALEDIQTFDKKQHDYGSDNIGDFGEYGVLVRANDKMQRIKNLSKKLELVGGVIDAVTAGPMNESIEDTWLDLSIYGIIARMCRNGSWPK